MKLSYELETLFTGQGRQQNVKYIIGNKMTKNKLYCSKVKSQQVT